MVNNLDLEEQEQLDQIKFFWKNYGNSITWALIFILGIFSTWNIYKYYQRNQATQASAMYEEVERSAISDVKIKIDRSFVDMKDRFASSSYAQQAGLLVAAKYHTNSEIEASKSALSWVADKSSDEGYQSIAKLRLVGFLVESKSYDEALKELIGKFPSYFDPLIADRRGDIFVSQGKIKEAIIEYQKSFKMFEERTEYRHLVEVKLLSLGVDPKSEIQKTLHSEGKK